ncbi:GGDEF domain-containing protein [Clostridium algoriphilum]|uniref:GGDEF domain-containing protein n=1 Tax=Clostridium algoriphilum TaxID=198347 RepID=UPI001CF5B62D|nr:GGDEF domain-containing protein [Clostridium algoriphilum]MCB2294732.1 GGDEF domain-containing protein [Clostridium algoriphilum]
MKYKAKLEIFISILVLSILNGVVLSKGIVYIYCYRLLYCVLTAIIFGVLYYLSFLRVYSEYNLLKQTNKQLLIELKTDKLTGLFNRGTFDLDLKNILDSEIYSAIFIDVDDFRNFNNEYGHSVGDKVLIDVSKAIKYGIRKNDMAYRYGGEEIVIILKGCDKESAFIVAEKIRTNVSSFDNSPLPKITISLGVSGYPYDGQTVEEIIRACDVALLYAKKNGKNKTVIFNKNIDLLKYN